MNNKEIFNKKRILFATLLTLLCFATAKASTCNLGCQNDGGEKIKDVLGYLPGHVYEYALTSVLNLDVYNVTSKSDAINVEYGAGDEGTESGKNQLKISADVAVYAQGNCIYTLKLNALKIVSSVEGVTKTELKNLNEPIQFSLNTNGKVQPELCIKSADSENHYVLNIKRGIVSLLQTHLIESEVNSEVDIYGTCRTRTSQHDNLVIKVRNLNDCQQREHLNSGLAVGAAGFVHPDGAGLYNTPYLQGDYYKRTKINDAKVIEQVEVNEIYRQGAGAHSTETIGAYAKARTNFKLVKTGAAQAPNLNGGTQTVSIIFDVVGAKEGLAKNVQVLRETLNELVPRLQGQVQKGAAQQFAELVRLMRAADFTTLLELSNVQASNAEQKSLAHKVYLDALFRIRTSSSARAIFKLYPKLNKKEQFLAIASLHLIQHVDLDTIKAANSVLADNSGNNNIYLVIGHLVKKYCSTNSKESCASAVEEVSKQFVQQAKQCQATNAQEEEHLLAVLKGIANIQHVNSALINTLTQCLTSERISQRLQVETLKTVAKSASCDNGLQQHALDILKDIQEDSELRIEAYLTSVECANDHVAQTLTQLLASKEPSQQVLGFIYTHLRVLRDSTDTTRATQRQKLENVIETIENNLPLNWRRLSFNQELSYKFPAFGASASGDFKLIYSQQPGFLPRSVHLNFTSEIFGHNYNLLQLDARQENIERILEYYLGPRGLVNKDVEDITKIITNAATGHPRARRSLLTEAQKLAKKYKSYGNKKAQNLGGTPLNLDLSVKIFGSEIGFLSLGDNIPQTIEELLTQLTDILENTKRGVKDFSKKFHLHTLFLDTELLYSTSVGIPLSLSAQGFAASQYDVALQFDVDTFTQDWSAANYRLKFVPSIDAEVQYRLGYITPVINNGVRVVARLHTVTGSDFAINFSNGGKGFKAEIELPSEQIDLIHVQTTTHFYVEESEKAKTTNIPLSVELSAAADAKPSTLCFNQLEEYTGFDFCVETNAIGVDDWEKTILRPIDFHLYIHAPKKLVISGEQTQNDNERKWQLNYITPNSAESHYTKLALTLANLPNKNVHFELHNPKVQFSAELGLKSDAQEAVVYLHSKHNAKNSLSKIGFHKISAHEYVPIIELQTLNGEITKDIAGYTVTGRLRLNENGNERKYTFDKFSLEHVPTKEQLTQLNGYVELQNTAIKTELYITNADKNTYFINSQLGLLKQSYNAAFFINDERTPNNVFGASLNYQAGQEWHVIFVGKAHEWDIELNSDEKLNEKQPEFTIKSTLSHKKQLFSLVKLHALYPTNDQLKFDLELQRQKHLANLHVNLVRNLNKNGNYLADIKANFNKHSLSLLAKGDLNKNDRYTIDAKLSTSWGSAATLQGQIGDHYTIEDIYIDLNGNLQWSAKQSPQQLQLKVIGTADKTTADVLLTHDSNDLLKLNGEWQHAQEKTHAVKANLQLKNLITTKIDFKVAKTGKGELKVNSEILKSSEPKKLELIAKFIVQTATKYDIDAQLFLNGDKQSPVFHLKTDNVIEKQKFSTENVIEFINKKVSFNAHANSKGEWRANGEVTGDFVLILPDGQQVEGSGKRKLTTNPKTGILSGTGDWSVTHTISDGKKRTLSAKMKLEKVLPAQKIIVNEVNYVYVNTEGKKLDVQLQVNHVPKNHGKSHALDAKLLTHGDLIDNHLEFKIKLDEYNCNLAKFDAYVVFGELFKGNVRGNYDFNEKTAYTHAIDLNLEYRGKQLNQYKLHSNGNWIKALRGKSGQIQQEITQTYNGKQCNFNFNAEGNENKGKYDLNLKTSESVEPLTVNGVYERNANKLKHILDVKKGEKYLKTEFDVEVENNEQLRVHYKLQRDVGSQIELTLLTKDEKENYLINLELKHNENDRYVVDGTIYKGTTHKQGVALHVSAPTLNKKLTVVSVFEKTGYRQGKLQIELAEVFGLDLTADLNIDLQELEHLNIELLWNSEKLQLKQYSLKFNAENANKLHFNLKNAQETIVNGVLTHAKKEEANKSIIEGQGQLEYRGKKQQGNFRLIRQNFEINADNEVGVSYSFSGQIGAKNGVANLKLTNKEFNVKLSACEEKKQCSNLQVQSLISIDDHSQDSGRHSLLVLVDLRELGYPYEFELQSKTQRQGFKAQYNLDSKLVSNNNHRYELIASLSSLGAGQIQLQLPKREILLELQQQLPADNAIFGHYEQSVALWLNHKKKPQEVTRLKLSGNLKGESGQHGQLTVDGSIKLEHPNLRTISVEGKVDAQRAQQSINTYIIFDVFKNANQKVQLQNEFKNQPGSINWQFKHELTAPVLAFENKIFANTLLTTADTKDWKFVSELKVDTKFENVEYVPVISAFELSSGQLKLHLEALTEPLLVLESDWIKNKGLKTHTKFQLLSRQPIEIRTELDASSVKVNVNRAQDFDSEASLKLGKEITVRLSDGSGQNFLNGRVALDTKNFLQTQYESHPEKLTEHLKNAEKNLLQQTNYSLEKLKERTLKLQNHSKVLKKSLEDSLLDLTPLQKSLTSNFDEILQELEVDPMIKQIAVITRKIITTIEKFVNSLNQQIHNFYTHASKSFEDLNAKLQDVLENSLIPIWQKFVTNATEILAQIRHHLLELHVKITNDIFEIVEKYADVLKPYGKVLQDGLKAINEANQDFYKLIADELNGFFNELEELFQQINLKNLQPLFDNLQKQWKQWKLTENIVDLFKQLLDQLQLLPLTAESSEFLQKLQDYITQKLNKQQTNINIESLLTLFVKAIRSILLETLSTYEHHAYFPISSEHLSQPILHILNQSIELLNKIPALFTIRLSLLNFIVNEIHTNWSGNKNLKNSWFTLSLLDPFDLHAHVVNGQQFVTFDGLYNDYKADNCHYILAQDAINQNFTIVAHQQHNRLRSLALITHDGEQLEVFDNGNLKLNEANFEYPLHTSTLHAWQRYYSVSLYTNYGVEITCLKDLSVCHIKVNGYYAGQLRGLLGNANTERFDDRLLPEGNLASKSLDLGNAYTLGKCGTATASENLPLENAENSCSEIFDWKSKLSAGFIFLDPTAYLQACQVALTAVPEAEQHLKACEWAFTYASALRSENLPVDVPDSCLQCAKNQALHQELNVKLPGNKMDVLFIINLQTDEYYLKNIIQPLFHDLRESLKQRSFTDVQFGVIAFNSTQKYSAYLSSNSGKTANYDGNLAEIDLLHAPVNIYTAYLQQIFSMLPIANEKLFNWLFIEKLPNAENNAYDFALKYPFRAQASSAVVIVANKDWPTWDLMKFLIEVTGEVSNSEKPIMHLLAPIDDMSVEGISNEKLLGFNSRLIATLDGKDPKKRSKLVYKNNPAIQFVLATGGWVFDNSHAANQAKEKVLAQISNTIADTSFKTEQVTECKCQSVYGIFAENKCTVKSTNFVPNKKVKAK